MEVDYPGVAGVAIMGVRRRDAPSLALGDALACGALCADLPRRRLCVPLGRTWASESCEEACIKDAEQRLDARVFVIEVAFIPSFCCSVLDASASDGLPTGPLRRLSDGLARK